ncbi:MAG TPA: hypothetical protein VER03_03325 [Bryobacteraceae bacterium]|nr:hypothetical protein [Bryobacteraceae bacterium]
MPSKAALLCIALLIAATGFAADVRVPVSADEEALLKAADFEATIDGIGKAAVTAIRTPKDDLIVLLVMDVVGDLAYGAPAKSALAATFHEIPERIHVTILRAQEGLRVVLDPTADRDAIEEAITNVPVNGKAGLLDTVESAAQLADAVAVKSNVRVAVLYITDSDVRNYREDFTNPVINSSDSRDLSRRFPEGLIRERISRVSASLARSQTPVFLVHLRYSRERLDEAYQNGLSQLTRISGGAAQFCRSAAEIPDAIAQTMGALTRQYRVHVQLPAKPPKSLNVTLSSGGRQLGYRTRFVLR